MKSNNSNTAVNWFMALPFDERIAIANKYFPQYAEDNTDLDDEEIAHIYLAEHTQPLKEDTQKYIIRDREAGNVIDDFNTLMEAERALNDYETQDKRNGEYTPDFYEIVQPEDTPNTGTGELMKTHKLTMLAAMEFGYRECEKGNNLDMAFINFNKALNNK